MYIQADLFNKLPTRSEQVMAPTRAQKNTVYCDCDTVMVPFQAYLYQCPACKKTRSVESVVEQVTRLEQTETVE